MQIVLIGPPCAGKSTLGRLLAESLGLPQRPLDTLKYDYFKEIGYNETLASKMYKERGFTELYEYWKPFEAYSVERGLGEHKNCVMDFGAGHSIYDDKGLFERVKNILEPNPYVILLLPVPDKNEALKILNKREGLDTEKYFNFCELFLNTPYNYIIAKHVVYTGEDTPGETRDKIIDLLELGAMRVEQVIRGDNIYLKKADYKSWAAAKNKRYFDGYQKFDPCMPVKNEDEEKAYYIDHVDSDFTLLYGIYTNENEHIGYINAFELFVPGRKRQKSFGNSIPGGVCETGIWLFGEKYFGKGYASEAYRLFFEEVLKKHKLEKTIISTYDGNERAVGLYKKLGYKESGSYKDGEYWYVKMELLF